MGLDGLRADAQPVRDFLRAEALGDQLQDLALAGRYYELLGARAGLAGKADFPRER
mgnify:CR=1 FL=1